MRGGTNTTGPDLLLCAGVSRRSTTSPPAGPPDEKRSILAVLLVLDALLESVHFLLNLRPFRQLRFEFIDPVFPHDQALAEAAGLVATLQRLTDVFRPADPRSSASRSNSAFKRSRIRTDTCFRSP